MADRVLLLGAGGKTGWAYAQLLQRHGHHVLWYDKNPKQEPQQLNAAQLTHVPADKLDFSALKGQFDWLTLTPGVPRQQDFIIQAQKAGVRVISEVAYVAPSLQQFQIIGITGTDGKSTTTTLIGQLLRALGHDALECGNFGIPLSEIALDMEKYAGKILVCELSSYQLEEPGSLSLDVGIFLNLAPDHLNRYTDIEEYGLAKWNILACIKPKGLMIVSENLTAEKTPYWKNKHPLHNFGGRVIVIDTQRLTTPHFAADQIVTSLAGRHNISNLLFALEAVREFHGNAIDPEVLKNLKALPHRFEHIPQSVFLQMTFINDSKATTTQAAMVAIENAGAPVFIFLGGQGKGERYMEFGEKLKASGAFALIYGECRNDMASDFRAVGFENFTLHENLFKAFHTAKRMVIQQKLTHATLLLSPAVTSWDQFSSFEERGDFFRGLVNSLT